MELNLIKGPIVEFNKRPDSVIYKIVYQDCNYLLEGRPMHQ